MLPKFSTYETSHNVKEASYFLQSDLEITTNEGIGASRTIIGDPMLSKINLAIADNLLLVKPTADTPFRITVNALTEAKPSVAPAPVYVKVVVNVFPVPSGPRYCR